MKIFVSLSISTTKQRQGDRRAKSSRQESAWWKDMSRKEQRQYLAEHKLSRKKLLNLRDKEGRKSKMTPDQNKVTDPTKNQNRVMRRHGRAGYGSGRSAKPKKRTYTSEELLKNAGISWGGSDNENGLAKHSPVGQHRPGGSGYAQGNRQAQYNQSPYRENSVVRNTPNLPDVPPEHRDWQGFRKTAYKHLDVMSNRHRESMKSYPKVEMNRAYNGISEFMQGNQPNPLKRQSAERMMLSHVSALRDNMPENDKLHSLSKYDKEMVSMYFGSVKKRYAGKPSPFSEKTHAALSRFKPNKSEFKSKSSMRLEANLGFGSSTKSDDDHFDHVNKFVGSDFVEWLSSQDHKKMTHYLKARRNNRLTMEDATAFIKSK